MGKICPFALANPNFMDYSCEQEYCEWWDSENNCCVVQTLVKNFKISKEEKHDTVKT
ncbi:MAG: hypothetical protein QXV73_05595 [Candidatus Micrarchaeia archaeon]